MNTGRFFDWSGVISDDRRPVWEANCIMIEKRNLQPHTFKQWLANSKATAAQYLQECFGIDESSEDLNREYARTFKKVARRHDGHVMYDGVPEALATLRDAGHILTVISTHPFENLISEAERYGIRDLFNTMIGSQDGANIDKAEAITKLTEAYDIGLGRVVFTGDTIYDLSAGRQARVRVAAVTDGFHSAQLLAESEPDYIAKSVADLVRMPGFCLDPADPSDRFI